MSDPISLDGYDGIRLIGEGGLGRVFQARRTSTGGSVAIKELRDVDEASPAWHRARREVEALLRLKGHPNVVNVEELVQGPHGPCLVMEFAAGGSLMDRLRHGPFTAPEIVLIGQQVSRALADAHAVGIIHRDIKPHNLLIGAFGQVKVCDFGIASLVRDGGDRTTTAAFTMTYASPEEVDGVATIGSPADVYSFGATLLHLITGRRPTFKDRADGPTADFGELPAALRPIVTTLRHCLAHDPSQRPTMIELLNTFDDASHQLGSSRVRGIDALSEAPDDDRTVVRTTTAEPPLPPPPTLIPPTSTPPAPTVAADTMRPRVAPTPTDTPAMATAGRATPGRRAPRWMPAALVVVVVALGLVAVLASGGEDDSGESADTSAASAPASTAATPMGSLELFASSFPNLATFECGDLKTFASGSDYVECVGPQCATSGMVSPQSPAETCPLAAFYVGRLPPGSSVEQYISSFPDSFNGVAEWTDQQGTVCGLEVEFATDGTVFAVERLFDDAEVYLGHYGAGFPQGLTTADGLC